MSDAQLAKLRELAEKGEREKDALQWLMDTFGTDDVDAHGPTLNLSKVTIGDDLIVLYLIGKDAQNYRFSQVLAAYAEARASRAEQATKAAQDLLALALADHESESNGRIIAESRLAAERERVIPEVWQILAEKIHAEVNGTRSHVEAYALRLSREIKEARLATGERTKS